MRYCSSTHGAHDGSAFARPVLFHAAVERAKDVAFSFEGVINGRGSDIVMGDVGFVEGMDSVD